MVEIAAFDVTGYAAVADAVGRLGVLDVLVNNAGIQRRALFGGFSGSNVARVDAHQPGQRVLCGSGGGAGDDRSEAGQDHQYLLGAERIGPAQHRALCGEQGRGEDADQGDVRRLGSVWFAGERAWAGIFRDGTDSRVGGRSRVFRLAVQANAGRALGTGRRTGGRGDLSGVGGVGFCKAGAGHLCGWRIDQPWFDGAVDSQGAAGPGRQSASAA